MCPVCYCGNDFDDVIRLMDEGKIPANGFITKKVALDDIVSEGFETLTLDSLKRNCRRSG